MIIKNYKHSSTFEEFISNVYLPVQIALPSQQQYIRSNSGNIIIVMHNQYNDNYFILEKYKPEDYTSESSSNLAAALIDSLRNKNSKGNLHKNISLMLYFIILYYSIKKKRKIIL